MDDTNPQLHDAEQRRITTLPVPEGLYQALKTGTITRIEYRNGDIVIHYASATEEGSFQIPVRDATTVNDLKYAVEDNKLKFMHESEAALHVAGTPPREGEVLVQDFNDRIREQYRDALNKCRHALGLPEEK